MVYRDPDIEKYKKSVQFIIDGWALIKVSLELCGESNYVGTKAEVGAAVDVFMDSNPVLVPDEFLYMYPLLREHGYSDEFIDDIFGDFERGERLPTLFA